MTVQDPKSALHGYLESGREALLWKCEGLSEYDVRRPLVRTGTNLLGLVKHLTMVELGYFGQTFNRPSDIELSWWDDDAEPNVDLWARPEEGREELLDLYRRAAEHADETIGALDLEARGRVPWWGDRGEVTLHQVLVHVTTETHRHAGHADILRELIDGAAGLRPNNDNLWAGEAEDYWEAHRARVESAAKEAAVRAEREESDEDARPTLTATAEPGGIDARSRQIAAGRRSPAGRSTVAPADAAARAPPRVRARRPTGRWSGALRGW